ncbi:hypothetical protein PHLCEN_2v11150 [Hermanssonia centrifuga]|uniref:Uncharacterized protein n=1 Tax=Hermanssonia centrifuga TaxID=98765 RepID=A0A1U7KUH7_9APHY|nr:hypothetical protein PHLCEN_2v11150 [Hermanssonia centrifuga]
MSVIQTDPVLDMFNTTLPAEIEAVSGMEAQNSSTAVEVSDDQDASEILPTPSVLRTTAQCNKRPADDLTECAEQAGRRVRLKPANIKELVRVAKFSTEERGIYQLAFLMKIDESLKLINFSEMTHWSISALLTYKIELYTFTVIASPSLSSYVTDGYPTQLVMGVLERHPVWGYTKEVREDPLKKKIVLNKVMTRLTDRRAKIKGVIIESLGAIHPLDPSKNRQPRDILELCQDIAGLAGGSLDEDKFKVTLQMCARVALFRSVLTTTYAHAIQTALAKRQAVPSFWSTVDKSLDGIRARCNNNATLLSQGFKAILDKDLDTYGQAPVSDYSGVEITPSQQVSEGAVRGRAIMEDEV